jgi:hypothetical protein
MADGNCLIFFAEETSDEDPKPMCRIHSQVLEQARSIFMINLLRYGEIVLDEDEAASNSQRSTLNTTSSGTWPLSEKLLGSLDEFLNDDSTLNSFTGRNNNRASPLISEDEATLIGQQHSLSQRATPGDITHEIWFRAPSHITRPDIQRRHHMATRNYLALLYGMPLVGNDYFEMLSDLQNVMDTYYELNDPLERWNSAQVIIQYLITRQLDDVRGNLSAALGLMAWAEQPTVRWESGYFEGFVHASGMMSPRTVEMREFKVLSQVSRHKLQNAYNALQLRLMEAEDRLKKFDFAELWYAEGAESGHPAQRSYDEFRNFLHTFYVTVYGNWPPKEVDHTGRWLSRVVVDRLQTDLGALYDYIVDRDVEWDVSEERHTRKWEMVSKGSYRVNGSFRADFPGLPITNMLVGFDTSMRYEHIPHPFPLLPSNSSGTKERSIKKSLFGKKLSSKKMSNVAGPKEQFQMALAFTAATNVDRLGTSFKGMTSGFTQYVGKTNLDIIENKVLDTFQHHEKSFPPSVLNPSDARLGRWVLIYSVLQVISTLSVDVIGMKYSSKIRYFASPSLSGLPPWQRGNGGSTSPSLSASDAASSTSAVNALMREATQKMSYCWLAPSRWANGSATGSGDLTPTPPAYEMQATLLAPPGDFMTLRGSASASSLSELDGRALARARSMRNALPHGGMSGLGHPGQATSHVITGNTPPPAFSSIIRQQQSGQSISPPPAFSSLAQSQPTGSSPPPAFSSLAPAIKSAKSPLTSTSKGVTTTTISGGTSVLAHHPLTSPLSIAATPAALTTPSSSGSPSPLISSLITSPNLNFAPSGSPPNAPPLKPSSPATYSLLPTSITSAGAGAGLTSPPRKFASPPPLPPPLVGDAQRDGVPRIPSGVRGVDRGNNGLVGIMVQKDVEVMSRLGDPRPGFM